MNVSHDLCNRIKCNAATDAQQHDQATLIECAREYGPGNYSRCDPFCSMYHSDAQLSVCNGLKTASPAAMKSAVSPALSRDPLGSVQALTPSSITRVFPDITANPVPAASSGSDAGTMWCSLNSYIEANPVIALAGLAAIYFLVKGGK